MRPLLACIVLCASTAASAACEDAYTHDEWRSDMDRADASFAEARVHQATVALAHSRDRLPCLDEVAQVDALDRFATQLSLAYFFQMEEDSSTRWAHLISTPPEGADHPAWSEMLEFADTPMIGGPVAAAVATPRNGMVYMDGTPLVVPRAAAEVPHLVQVVDRSGQVVESYWQDGARFRPSLLVDPDTRGTSQGGSLALGTGAGAGGLAIASAVLYGAANAWAQPVVRGEGGQDELIAARNRANTAVVGAAVAGAGAVGLGLTSAVSARGVGLQIAF